jgi:hypothetical protein
MGQLINPTSLSFLEITTSFTYSCRTDILIFDSSIAGFISLNNWNIGYSTN